MDNARYTFGTTNAAANRLEEMAKFFNPLADMWIKKHLKNQLNAVVDLGCGPGYSTDMIAKAVSSKVVCGLEKSDEFIIIAKAKFPGFVFINHDVSDGTLPIRADAAYCRFLLSHLKDTEKTINSWINELLPGGMLFIDELEGINTDVPVFKKYLEINESLVKSQGAELFVGAALARGSYNAELVSNELARIPVASWRAASWFYPNTYTIWEKEKFVRDNFPQAIRRKISEEILGILEKRDASVKSIWKMRRIVLKKPVT